MASTRDIRRRIKSVKNTRQITKALELVAASKMKKAQQAALAGRPYAQLMADMLAALALHLPDAYVGMVDGRVRRGHELQPEELVGDPEHRLAQVLELQIGHLAPATTRD